MRQQVLRMEQELLNAESGGAPSTETKLTATASPATAPASTPTAVSMGTPATTSGANLVIFNSVTEGTVHMDTSESGEHGGGDEDPDARSIYVGNVCTCTSTCISQPFPFPSCAQNVDTVFWNAKRSTMALPQRRSKRTSPHVGLSTA